MSLAAEYNRTAYPGHVFADTHPGWTGGIAWMLGLEPPNPRTARILEIGCGDGANLAPIALSLPQSDCFGIDLASRPIERARALAAGAGLQNVRFEALDLTELNAAHGEFDYIICHGVFSWVPDEVRQALLRVIGERLSPHGVAYVSYNVMPGSAGREALRGMMRFHLQQTGAVDRGQAAQAFARLLGEHAGNHRPEWQKLVRKEVRRVLESPPEFLVHDDLAEFEKAFFLNEFVTLARAAGLEWLGNADLPNVKHRPATESVGPAVEQLAQGDRLLREQYLDFLTGRMFRETLLVRAPAQPTEEYQPERLDTLWFWAPVKEVEPAPEDRRPGVRRFTVPKGMAITTGHPHVHALLEIFGQLWPEPVSFAQLLGTLKPAFRQTAAPLGAAELRQALLFLDSIRMVGPWLVPLECTGEVSERPLASPLARWQARQGPGRLTSLLLVPVELTDQPSAALLRLLNGERTIAEITRDFQPHSPGATEEQVTEAIGSLARLGLLLA